jgi:TonB family protein
VNVGFQTLTVPDVVLSDIPPPNYDLLIREADFTGRGLEGGTANQAPGPVEDIAAAPVFTPREVEPELRNRDEVSAALQRAYPGMLRDAGVGGTAILWFFINEQGVVTQTQVFESSGYPALDQAATEVASIMRFSPALNRDEAVPVWVQIPIEFRPVTQ